MTIIIVEVITARVRQVDFGTNSNCNTSLVLTRGYRYDSSMRNPICHQSDANQQFILYNVGRIQFVTSPDDIPNTGFKMLYDTETRS